MSNHLELRNDLCHLVRTAGKPRPLYSLAGLVALVEADPMVAMVRDIGIKAMARRSKARMPLCISAIRQYLKTKSCMLKHVRMRLTPNKRTSRKTGCTCHNH